MNQLKELCPCLPRNAPAWCISKPVFPALHAEIRTSGDTPSDTHHQASSSVSIRLDDLLPTANCKQ